MAAVRGKLGTLLAGRDARAQAQKFILGVRGVTCAIQISLNIPGLPKDISGGAEAVAAARGFFLNILAAELLFCVVLRGASGIAEIFPFAGDAVEAKKAAIVAEDGREWGRVFDIDVITEKGPLSRESLGGRPRSCLLCEKPAKVCAREAGHPLGELRAEFIRLLRLARSGLRCP
jgi:holo-ACP synthase CitX